MTVHDRYHRDLGRRIGAIKEELGEAVQSIRSKRLRGLWPRWEERLDDVFDSGRERPDVRVALVGGVGAGKSTLINALIGAKLLPVSNQKACTSAVTEVSFSDGPGYEAVIEFVTREDIRREVEGLLDDVEVTAQIPSDLADDQLERKGAADLSKEARQRLLAIYDVKSGDELRRDDFAQMELPPEIAHALDEGTRSITCDTLAKLKDHIADYLSSRKRFWPIVRSTSIRGPFPALEGGATIVDLPGVNDPNEARERVTREYFKSSRFIWVVLGSNRLLTKDVSELLHQLSMEGRVDDLTFIATASDNVDHETGISEFGLEDEASKLDVILARNRAARPEIARQLQDLADTFAFAAREGPQKAEELARRLTASPMFTVSAREFLRLAGVSKNDPAGLDDPEQTEVPALRRHLAEISARHDVSALFRRLHDQVDHLLTEVASEVDGRIMRLNARFESNQQQREDVEAALDRVGSFLGPRLAELERHLAQDLAAGRELLGERMKRAVDRGQAELDQYLKRLAAMHWASMRSMVRKDGRYVGSAGEFNCSADIARPVLNSIAFAYSEFFADRLARVLQGGADRLNGVADDHRRALLDALTAVVGPESPMRADLKKFSENAGKVVAEQLAQTMARTERKIQDVQKDLYGSIVAQVQANMVPAYRKAAQVSGPGAKARMFEILSKHARQVSETMFGDAERAILDGVRGLDDWLGRQYAEMIATVSRQAEVAADNLRLGTAQIAPLDELEGRRDAMRSLEAIIESLGHPSASLAASA